MPAYEGPDHSSNLVYALVEGEQTRRRGRAGTNSSARRPTNCTERKQAFEGQELPNQNLLSCGVVAGASDDDVGGDQAGADAGRWRPCGRIS
mmetsp:Transcript_47760/g.103971  ORF Transcript_47760/g.103971 Transcript_47760/m.103971 type:complete len:92 (+) Transcript_47760:3452-3727(+)